MSIIRMTIADVLKHYDRLGMRPHQDILSLQVTRRRALPEIEQPTHTEGRPAVIELDLPYLLPGMNERQRRAWNTARQKQRWTTILTRDINALIVEQYGSWIYAPYAHAWMVIERVSSASREPDHDNLAASVKELVDVLQPMHPTIRPYGLGIITGDHPQVLHRCIQWRRPIENENQHTHVTVKLL